MAKKGLVSDFLVRNPRLLVALAILYVLSPIDLAPEAILGPLGWIDDIFVALLTVGVQLFARNTDDENRSKRPKDYYDTTAR